MFKTLLNDRRVWLLALTVGLVVAVCRWTLATGPALSLVVNGGYWLTLALVIAFAAALVPVVRSGWASVQWKRFDLWVLAGVMTTSAVWVAHEKPGYKILQDELLLLGTSMGMHYERRAAYPERATDVQGAFQILDSVLDKRPLLFPFLAATIHDLTGYRPENPFYLNMILGAAFLWLAYLLGWDAGRERWAGVAALLLFAGLPLMAQQSTGGGFDLLNLLLLTALLLTMARYLDEPGERRLEVMVFCALLVASTRYESALFLVPAAVAALVGWWRANRVILTWRLLVSPIFLAPILLQNRIFSSQPEAWQMQSIQGVTEPFGLQYIVPNLGHALAFFYDFSGYQPSSAVFATLGLMALPFFVLWMARVLRIPGMRRSADLSWTIGGLSLLAVTLLYLCYFWGQFDQPLIHRLSLPVHLLMMVAIVIICRLSFRTVRHWKLLSLVALGGILVQGLPVLAKQAYRTSYSPGVQMQMRDEFLHSLSNRNILFIDNDSFFWITHQIPATPIKGALYRKEGLIYHLRNHSFADVYVFQSLRVNPDTGKPVLEAADDLGSDFELETVWERRIQTLYLSRISRIKSISSGGEIRAQAAPFVQPPPGRSTREELKKAQALYLQNWIKKLP